MESFTASVRLRKPSELEYISTGTIDVTVTIEPVIISTSLSSVRVNARGTSDTLRTGLGTGYVSAVITGPQAIVEKIRPSEVSAYVDVTGLPAGEYTLLLGCGKVSVQYPRRSGNGSRLCQRRHAQPHLQAGAL